MSIFIVIIYYINHQNLAYKQIQIVDYDFLLINIIEINKYKIISFLLLLFLNWEIIF